MKETKQAVKQTGQQGDVVIRRVECIPQGAVLVSKGRCVLAEGKSTGHAHVVEDEEAELVRVGERMLLKLGRQATVTHEEHGPVTLEAGVWEVGRVQEYDYLSQMAHNVAD